DESIRLWDAPTGAARRVLANHTRAVNDLQLRPAAEPRTLPMIASAGDDRTVRLWQPTIGRLVRFARLDSPALALAWTADGRRPWAACRDGRGCQVDPDEATIVANVPAIDGVAYAIAVAPDGSIVVAGSGGQLRRIDTSERIGA